MGFIVGTQSSEHDEAGSVCEAFKFSVMMARFIGLLFALVLSKHLFFSGYGTAQVQFIGH